MFMRKEFKLLLFDRVNKYGLYVSVGFILFGFIFFFLRVLELPPLVPIFYNRPWGPAQLGSPMSLLLLLFSSLIIFLVNLALAMKLYSKIVLLPRILIWVSVLTCFLVTTTVVRIILLIA